VPRSAVPIVRLANPDSLANSCCGKHGRCVGGVSRPTVNPSLTSCSGQPSVETPAAWPDRHRPSAQRSG
jgi:hypothetical protein